MAGISVNMSTSGLSEEYLAERAKLPECVVCERPMRPAGEKAADWPATVAYATTEQCKTCYNRKYVKSMSVADALKPVKHVKTRVRGVETTVPRLDLSRQQVAERWSPEERSAALLVCELADSAAEAAEVMELLGLFDIDKAMGYGQAHDPKGAKFN